MVEYHHCNTHHILVTLWWICGTQSGRFTTKTSLVAYNKVFMSSFNNINELLFYLSLQPASEIRCKILSLVSKICYSLHTSIQRFQFSGSIQRLSVSVIKNKYIFDCCDTELVKLWRVRFWWGIKQRSIWCKLAANATSLNLLFITDDNLAPNWTLLPPSKPKNTQHAEAHAALSLTE